MASQNYVRVNPRVFTIPLDVALNPAQFLPQCPQGSVITMIYFIRIPTAVNLVATFGQQEQFTVFQGNVFTFGGVGECIGAMDLGLTLGCGASAGDSVQLMVCFAPGNADVGTAQ